MADTGWNRPTLAELITQSSDDLASALGGAAPYVPKSLLWVAARVIAGTAHVVYGAVQYTSRQFFAHTADAAGVQAHAKEWKVEQAAAAKASDGWFRFHGTPTTPVDIGTEIVRSDGKVYVTTYAVAIAGDEYITAPGEAELAGSDGNAATGDGFTYQLGSPIAGVDTDVELALPFTNGSDEEDIESLRARVLQRKQKPPQGGAEADYVGWAETVSNVSGVWIVSALHYVYVLFVVEGTGSDIIPDAGDVAAVQAALENANAAGLTTRRPVTADAIATAPTPKTEDFDLTISPDTAANQAVIEDALNRLMLRRAGQQPTMSDYWLAVGEADLDTYTINSPSSPVAVASGECAVLGTVSYT